MRLKRELLIMLLLLIATIGNANETSTKTSLLDCIELALENNSYLKQSNLDRVIAENKIKEIKADILPQVNASAGITKNISSPVVILPGDLIGIPNVNIPVELVTPYEVSSRIELSQVIFNASLFTGIEIAKNVVELVRLKKELSEEELIYNIGVIFYDILYSEQLLLNINSNLRMQDSLYVYMSHRKDQDLIREIDLNRIKVEITSLEVQEKQLKIKIDQQKRYLKILIGFPLDKLLKLDDSELQSINLPEEMIANEYDISNRYELALLHKQKEIEFLNLKSIRNKYMPNFSFIAAGGYLFQSNNLRLKTKESWFDYSFIGFQLNIPIFDGFRKQSKVQQAKLNIRKLNEDIKFAEENLLSQHKDAEQRLLIGYQSIGAQEDNLKLAESIYKQSRLLYKEGLHSTTDLLQTEIALQNAQGAYLSEVIKYKKAELDFMKAKGILNNLLNTK